MKRLSLALSLLVILWSPAAGGPNAGGTLVVHDAQIDFTDLGDLTQPPVSTPPADCAGVDNTLAVSPSAAVMRVWKVYAAFPTGSCPRLKGLAWGISDLETGRVYVVGAGLPDPPNDFQIVQGNWPRPAGGGSIGQSFVFTQTSTMVECYWFGGYGYDGGVFATVRHASQPSDFVDDAIPGNVDHIAGFSTMGIGTAGTTACPAAASGACCAPQGDCTITTSDNCQAPDTWYGACTVCSPNPCPIPTGACCAADGTCTVTPEAACSGQWTMFGVCTPNPCVQPEGACCAADGSCTVTLQSDCTGSWIMFAGCTPDPCTQPEGACCLTDGTCVVTFESGCPTGYWTADVACVPNPCPQPTGACCFPDGSCTESLQTACSGQWTMFGVCTPNPCDQPPPTGACCFPTGDCVTETETDCLAAGGTYYGDSCEPNPCPQPPPGGPNAGGTLIVHDTGLAYTDGSSSYPSPVPDCANVDNEIDTTDLSVWKVYAAFNPYGSPRLKGLAWGINLTPGLRVLDAGLSDPATQFEITQGGWPNTSGAGIGMSFSETQTAHVVECYWFGGYAYSLPQSFGTGNHPTQFTAFVDDGSPGNEDPIAGHSALGFGHEGLTSCPDVIIPGACCFPDGSCQVLLPNECLVWGGQILGADCSPGLCPQPPPTGACCFPDGTCSTLLETECPAAGGVFLGGSCEPNPCPQPPAGACCFGTGSCSMLTPVVCAGSGGSFLDGPCEPNPCPQPPPTGACCFASGACAMMTSAACASAGGTYHGGSCTPNPCPQPPPTGACCFAGGACVMMTSAGCAAAGGEYHGGSCTPNPCPSSPPPTGACCLADGSCMMLTPDACAAAGGTYYGGSCSPAPPCGSPPPGGGGDTLADATVIPYLPFVDTGTTTGYNHDYDSSCGSNSAPDVVYTYTPTSSGLINISLCGSSYDTVVHIHDSAIGNEIGCNDDFCGLQSELDDLPVTAGHRYIIIVAGFSTDSGAYTITMATFIPPPPVECPSGAMNENEPNCQDNYIDNYNGGCNSTPARWQDLSAQAGGCATMCGYSCTYLEGGSSLRDTDWYLSTGTGTVCTLSGTASFGYMLAQMYGTNCANLQYQYVYNNANVVSTLTYTIANGAQVGSFMAPSTFSGVPNGRYWIVVCGIQNGWPTATETTSWGSIKARFLRPAAGSRRSVAEPGPTTGPPAKPAMSSEPATSSVPVLLQTSRPPKPLPPAGGSEAPPRP